MCWVACVAYRARAALPLRARAEEVRGLWTLTIWPLRGLVSSLGVFVSGKQSGLNLVGVGWAGVVWCVGEGVSKASMTPLLHSHRFPSAALKESSPCSMLLCAKAAGQSWSSNTSVIFRLEWNKAKFPWRLTRLMIWFLRRGEQVDLFDLHPYACSLGSDWHYNHNN